MSECPDREYDDEFYFILCTDDCPEDCMADHRGREMSDLRAALVAIQELHRSVPIYTTWVEDCGHDFECDPVEIDGDFYCPDATDGVTCAECADIAKNFGLDDGLPSWPCDTRRLADDALGGDQDG